VVPIHRLDHVACRCDNCRCYSGIAQFDRGSGRSCPPASSPSRLRRSVREWRANLGLRQREASEPQRYKLIATDEVGYVPLAEVGVARLFHEIAERAERSAVILTTNLPVSEFGRRSEARTIMCHLPRPAVGYCSLEKTSIEYRTVLVPPSPRQPWRTPTSTRW
jgi:hypothetical protein